MKKVRRRKRSATVVPATVNCETAWLAPAEEHRHHARLASASRAKPVVAGNESDDEGDSDSDSSSSESSSSESYVEDSIRGATTGVEDLFDGQLSSIVICDACSHVRPLVLRL